MSVISVRNYTIYSSPMVRLLMCVSLMVALAMASQSPSSVSCKSGGVVAVAAKCPSGMTLAGSECCPQENLITKTCKEQSIAGPALAGTCPVGFSVIGDFCCEEKNGIITTTGKQ